MSAARIVAGVFGAVLAVCAIALLFAGGGLLVASALRSQDGFVWSDSVSVKSTDAYALAAADFEIATDVDPWIGMVAAEVRLEVTGQGPGRIFVGLGPAVDVERYLAGVSREIVHPFRRNQPLSLRRIVEGGPPPTPPTAQTFWATSTEGTGTQTLSWKLSPGIWSLVVMNADASPGVDVTARAGASLPLLVPIALGLLVGGVLVAAVAAGLLAWGIAGSPDAGAPANTVGGSGPPTGFYPLTVEGDLVEPLSRWLWLVKWFLAIPHLILLAFLWIAFWVVTIIAFFAILFTERYPRGLFTFNVGVLRWTWRVFFYAFTPVATDRYPPFSLGPADYPARLDVAYPETLSRGLVLVKWWLLAIPHYLIVAAFTNGLTWGAVNPDHAGPAFRIGGGLVGLLVIIALIGLLVTGRYLRGLFDLVMGLVRWGFRLVAYAALMRDEYPPFRLDLGGGEPASTSGGGTAAGVPLAGAERRA